MGFLVWPVDPWPELDRALPIPDPKSTNVEQGVLTPRPPNCDLHSPEREPPAALQRDGRPAGSRG